MGPGGEGQDSCEPGSAGELRWDTGTWGPPCDPMPLGDFLLQTASRGSPTGAETDVHPPSDTVPDVSALLPGVSHSRPFKPQMSPRGHVKSSVPYTPDAFLSAPTSAP